jgi:hypothetical protein
MRIANTAAQEKDSEVLYIAIPHSFYEGLRLLTKPYGAGQREECVTLIRQ